MIAWILNLFRRRSPALTVLEAYQRCTLAQLSNDPEVRKAARDDLDRALRGQA